MNDYTRITVPLSRKEFEALRDTARNEYRHPREQARYLLRSILLGEHRPENDNVGATVSQAKHADIVTA